MLMDVFQLSCVSYRSGKPGPALCRYQDRQDPDGCLMRILGVKAVS